MNRDEIRDMNRRLHAVERDINALPIAIGDPGTAAASSPPEVLRGSLTAATQAGQLWATVTPSAGFESLGTVRMALRGTEPRPAGSVVEAVRYPVARTLANSGQEPQAVEWEERVASEAVAPFEVLLGSLEQSVVPGQAWANVLPRPGYEPIGSPTRVALRGPEDRPAGSIIEAVRYPAPRLLVNSIAAGGDGEEEIVEWEERIVNDTVQSETQRAVVIAPAGGEASVSGDIAAGTYHNDPQHGRALRLVWEDDPASTDPRDGAWVLQDDRRQLVDTGITAGVLEVTIDSQPTTGNLWIEQAQAVYVPEVAADDANDPATSSDESVRIPTTLLDIDSVERVVAATGAPPEQGETADTFRVTLVDSYDLVPDAADSRTVRAFVVAGGIVDFENPSAYSDFGVGEEVLLLSGLGGPFPVAVPVDYWSAMKSHANYDRDLLQVYHHRAGEDEPRWDADDECNATE